MKSITVDLATRSYPIYIGDKALNFLNKLDCLKKASNLVVVTNHTVHALYFESVIQLLQSLNKPIVSVVLPDGEIYKNLSQLNCIYTAMLEARCDRKSLIIALGGGCIGDMAGYAAATYMRGIPFVQIPTTLLAQVDSSVGGKTGINHDLGKNMIGAFYQPQAVLADSSILSTLPLREVSAGLAEIIKYACIADAVFFDWLVSNIDLLKSLDSQAITYAVQRSCEIKASIVAQDETESSQVNIRALLNFGHTLGHALEMVLGYGTWLHGEAVGYGMVFAATLSHQLGLISITDVHRITDLINAANLPITWPKHALKEDILLAMKVDKKAEHGVLKFVVLDSIGQSHLQEVDESIVSTVINTLQT